MRIASLLLSASALALACSTSVDSGSGGSSSTSSTGAGQGGRGGQGGATGVAGSGGTAGQGGTGGTEACSYYCHGWGVSPHFDPANPDDPLCDPWYCTLTRPDGSYFVCCDPATNPDCNDLLCDQTLGPFTRADYIAQGFDPSGAMPCAAPKWCVAGPQDGTFHCYEPPGCCDEFGDQRTGCGMAP